MRFMNILDFVDREDEEWINGTFKRPESLSTSTIPSRVGLTNPAEQYEGFVIGQQTRQPIQSVAVALPLPHHRPHFVLRLTFRSSEGPWCHPPTSSGTVLSLLQPYQPLHKRNTHAATSPIHSSHAISSAVQCPPFRASPSPLSSFTPPLPASLRAPSPSLSSQPTTAGNSTTATPLAHRSTQSGYPSAT